MLPPLGYVVAWQTSGKTRHAWVVALMMLWSGAYFRVWTMVDNFTPFALAGALGLYAGWRSIKGGYAWPFIVGVMSGPRPSCAGRWTIVANCHWAGVAWICAYSAIAFSCL